MLVFSDYVGINFAQLEDHILMICVYDTAFLWREEQNLSSALYNLEEIPLR